MKMYLSSYKFGDNSQQLVDLVGSNKKAAVIADALDFATDLDRKNKGTQTEIEQLKSMGFSPEEVDLRNYFGKPKELADKMSQYGLIWVRGGNTFILRKAYKESGMDEWLKSQKENRELVYAGYSAGVCVLSPSLKGLENVDDPNVSAEGYSNEIIWDGVGLIDFVFVPHFESDHPESEATSKEVEGYQRQGIEYKALHDGEVIVIN